MTQGSHKPPAFSVTRSAASPPLRQGECTDRPDGARTASNYIDRFGLTALRSALLYFNYSAGHIICQADADAKTVVPVDFTVKSEGATAFKFLMNLVTAVYEHSTAAARPWRIANNATSASLEISLCPSFSYISIDVLVTRCVSFVTVFQNRLTLENFPTILQNRKGQTEVSVRRFWYERSTMGRNSTWSSEHMGGASPFRWRAAFLSRRGSMR